MTDLPLADIAYRELRHKLLNADYLPGQLLSEGELAEGLSMSRTPVRAAIARLEKEGYVETLKKRGVLVKGVDIKELYDMFDLMSALYFYALDVAEHHQYEIDLQAMQAHLTELIEASEHKRYRDYYENGLLFMRTILSAIENRSMLETFDTYKDKILFFVVAHRSVKGENRPYTGKKLYAEIYRLLSEGHYAEAKKAILESKWNVRDELVRSGSRI
ncbi:GntR family transcriptional regulator [Paenibacillus ginsengarvi]|uniref:GntR family transcriptional regulator n=1 Tax=Paenibacillus ginsengarvi TaxID=400777 RepID=A0A3B0AZW8_9BACL|nr:GntR family transcriptional regulator [Paenibacillus ginsengarvi]RKN65467.1 GntR family transcriptional regulator [Paenibacillus ginsengarvi]